MCTFNNGNTTHSPASNEDNDNNIHHLYQENNCDSNNVDSSTSPQQETYSSQEDVDEECNHLNPMTNQRIDNLTFNRLDARDSPTESDLLDMGMTHVHSDSLIQRFMAQRNAPSNDRITHPSDTFIGFLVNLLRALIMCCMYLKKNLNINKSIIRLMMFNVGFDNIRYGIQDSQPHSLVLPIRIITFREAIIIYDENNAMNIDATLPNSTIEDENMHSTIDLTWHDTTITRESIGEEEIGEPTNEAEENDDYSDVGDDQGTYGEASPPTKNSNVNKIPSHSTSHMPSAVLTKSSEQVEEIVPALATPTDNDAHVLSADTNESELNAGIRKHDRPFDGNTKRGEERPV
ncbi:unnamed protein product [Rotaria magnacalcarata]|uniref:Uncharacterized protein n=2 Tax=Rotaria magnacalcarata TaxID=392030 RepID=A0A8S2KRF9_9BILA|nr:unnamed protein product [Rotaria magnacalcarata]CAF3979638.1 unnamed protein product [Rotaria magnacalcarata]